MQQAVLDLLRHRAHAIQELVPLRGEPRDLLLKRGHVRCQLRVLAAILCQGLGARTLSFRFSFISKRVLTPQDKILLVKNLGGLYTKSGQTSECSFSSVSTPPIARVGSLKKHFSRSTRFSLLRTAPNPEFQQKSAKIFSYF